MNTPVVRFMLPFLSAAALAMVLSSCWYTRQAAYFLSERVRSVPVDRLADRAGLAAPVMELFGTVGRVRRFAVDFAGLTPGKNYTRYVTVDKDYVADVVSACAPDSFDRHYWRYPILGDLPYKGFYRKADAKKEAARLEAAGLDVIVREVDAFSSLGWFTDPLYSFMAGYDEDVVAELVIHESAHATLFVKGADQFNEEFATFVGRKGAELYLADRYGPGSPALARRRERQADGEAFVAYLKETARLLDKAYADRSIAKPEMLTRKAAIVADRAAVFRETSATMFADEAYRGFDMGSINNAYLDLYRLYEDDLELYEAWFATKASGSMASFVSTLSAMAATDGADIKASMARSLSR